MSANQSLPVRDVLALSALEGAKVVAGHAGLTRTVSTVNVMEVPDILQWVQPHELLLTTAYPLRDRPEALAELVLELDRRDLAGILIKPARYIEQVPRSMIEAADLRSFPVVELEPDASFNDIINGVLTVLLHRQAARLSRAQEIHDHFNRIVLTGGGFARICQALSEALGRPVLLLDIDGHLQAAAGGAAEITLPNARDVAEMAAAATTHRGRDAERTIGGFFVQPISAAGEVLGAILTPTDPGELSDDGREALQYAATISALRQVEAQALAAEDRRFATVYLEGVVNGESGDWRTLNERTRALGWDFSTPQTAVVISDHEHDDPTARGADHHLLRRLADAARTTTGSAAIVWERTSEVALLLVVDDVSPAVTRRAVEDVARGIIERLPGHTLTVGFGRAVEKPSGLHRSFAEARRARAVGTWSSPHGGVHGFIDLGVDRLLAGLDDAELEQYRKQMLGPLVTYDAAHHGELLPTLEEYLVTRNAAEAARRMYVHHNTLRNRLHRIEAILGPFLADGERCLSLALAIRIHRSAETRLTG